MKFLKKNWPYILIVVLIIALIFVSRKKNSDYDDQISVMNDSIEVLDNKNQILQIQVENSQELFVVSENDILLYQDTLDTYRATIYRNKKNYEAAIADIISIPTDSLYREVTRWLDNR